MEPLDLRFLEETFPFWKGLTLREQQKLLSQTRCYVYPKGSRIHSGLEGCTGVLAVKRGQLRAYLSRDDVDLTQDQANRAASLMYSNVEGGVLDGYLTPVGGAAAGTGGDSNSVLNRPQKGASQKQRKKRQALPV